MTMTLVQAHYWSGGVLQRPTNKFIFKVKNQKFSGARSDLVKERPCSDASWQQDLFFKKRPFDG